MFNEFCSGYLLDKNYAHNMYIVQMHSTLNFTSALTYFYTFQSSQGEVGQGDHNTDSNKDPITVMVLGAGRGPIVRATFNAADLTNTKVKVSPVFILSSIIYLMMLFSITTLCLNCLLLLPLRFLLKSFYIHFLNMMSGL